MQWGDLSFQSEKLSQFVAGENKQRNNLRFLKPFQKIGSPSYKGSVMDSRTMRLQSLSAIYAREHSKETLN
jgi:hypothetical protein